MADNTGWLIISKLDTLLSAKFTTASIYKADLLGIPNYPDSGTFTIEIIEGPTPAPEAITESIWDMYTFNIWVYLRYKDEEVGQENLIAIVENVVAYLREWAQVQTDTWWTSEITRVEYGQKIKGSERSITYVRAAGIEWQCQVSHER